jgi:hypothetical protein
MTWFFSAIDLTDNLQRALQAIRGITGTGALVLALALILVCCGLAPLAWYLDVDATLSWVEPTTETIVPTLPEEVLPYLSALVLMITFLPSLIELFTARFAAQMPAAAALIFVFSLFDAVTDYPRVAELLAQYESAYSTFGLLGIPLYWMSHPLLLFMATFGFELLLIVFSIAAMILLMNSGMGGRRRRRRAYGSQA